MNQYLMHRAFVALLGLTSVVLSAGCSSDGSGPGDAADSSGSDAIQNGQMHADDASCVPTCDTLQCGANSTCSTVGPQPTCSCNIGYTRQGTDCVAFASPRCAPSPPVSPGAACSPSESSSSVTVSFRNRCGILDNVSLYWVTPDCQEQHIADFPPGQLINNVNSFAGHVFRLRNNAQGGALILEYAVPSGRSRVTVPIGR